MSNNPLPKLGQTLSFEDKLRNFCKCPRFIKGAGQWTNATPGEEHEGRMVCCVCRKPSEAAGKKICAYCYCEYVDFNNPRWVVLRSGKVVEAVTFCQNCG